MSNLNLNKVILGGRLTSTPELKTTQSGVSVTTFTVAVNRRYVREGAEPEADFINCSAWRQTAEFITKYFTKGSSICVTGSIRVRKWQDDGGENHYAVGVDVDEAMFVDSKSEAAKEAPAKRERSERDAALAAETGTVFTLGELAAAARKVDGVKPPAVVESVNGSIGPNPEMASANEEDLPF